MKNQNKDKNQKELSRNFKKNFRLRKIGVLELNANQIWEKYMITLQKTYPSEVGFSSMKKMEKHLSFSKILKTLTERKVKFVRLQSMKKNCTCL